MTAARAWAAATAAAIEVSLYGKATGELLPTNGNVLRRFLSFPTTLDLDDIVKLTLYLRIIHQQLSTPFP